MRGVSERERKQGVAVLRSEGADDARAIDI